MSGGHRNSELGKLGLGLGLGVVLEQRELRVGEGHEQRVVRSPRSPHLSRVGLGLGLGLRRRFKLRLSVSVALMAARAQDTRVGPGSGQ